MDEVEPKPNEEQNNYCEERAKDKVDWEKISDIDLKIKDFNDNFNRLIVLWQLSGNI